VIARQDDHGFAVLAQHPRSAFEQIHRLSMIVERIAGKQDDVRLNFICGSEDFW